MRIGKKKFPRTAGRPGITNMNIMITPWTVNMALYVWGSMIVGPMVSCSRRMRTPIVTPTQNNVNMDTRYRMPILL